MPNIMLWVKPYKNTKSNGRKWKEITRKKEENTQYFLFKKKAIGWIIKVDSFWLFQIELICPFTV